ncbi:hypothetical protein QCA50_020471 [Cerrena zonata]|uniref:Uncharacterized protein n=1 Tax=Cerrena zonata TaxID=2478898 RepID=A0AAW0FCK4_9APHY
MSCNTTGGESHYETGTDVSESLSNVRSGVELRDDVPGRNVTQYGRYESPSSETTDQISRSTLALRYKSDLDLPSALYCINNGVAVYTKEASALVRYVPPKTPYGFFPDIFRREERFDLGFEN